MSDHPMRPPMVVGGRYKLTLALDGWDEGTTFECVGADTRDSRGEFRPARPKNGRERTGIWFFPWANMAAYSESAGTATDCEGKTR